MVKNKRHPASQEICPQSLDYLDVLANSASSLQQPDTSDHRPSVFEPEESIFLREGLNTPATRISLATRTASCEIIDTQPNPPEPMKVGIVSSCDASHDASFASLDDSDMYSAPASQPEYARYPQADGQPKSSMARLWGHGGLIYSYSVATSAIREHYSRHMGTEARLHTWGIQASHTRTGRPL